MEAFLLGLVEGIAKLGGAGWVFAALLLIVIWWRDKLLQEEYARGKIDTAKMTEVVTLATKAIDEATSAVTEGAKAQSESAEAVQGLAGHIEKLRTEMWQEIRGRKGP